MTAASPLIATAATPDLMHELRALNAKFIHNFITNDVASHDALLHPDFIAINTLGARVSRADYLRQWASGFDPERLPYWDTRDELITVAGDIALLRATNKWIARRPDGSEASGMTAYTDTYMRGTDGRWRCLQAQLTAVAPAHQPPDSSIVSVYLRGVLQARA